MAVWTLILSWLVVFWGLLKDWLYIFAAPFIKYNVVWIIIPIWLSWFFGEFFQEKKGTSFGNAISNGAVPIFVGIDWARNLTTTVIENKLPIDTLVIVKYVICFLAVAYGIAVVIYGIKGKNFIHFLGRLRTMTYVLLVFTPVVYGIIDLNVEFIGIILLFFPLYYYIIEFIDIITPDPKVLSIDTAKPEQDIGLGPDMGFPPSEDFFPQQDYQKPGKRPKF